MRINLITPLWFCFAPDGDGSGGDGEDEAQVRERGFQKKLKDFNDNALDFALSLWEDNFKYRQSNQSLRKQVDQTKLPEGAIVLTKEQAQAWTEYQALGTPEQVKTKVEERDQFQGKLTTLERDSIIQRAASVTGFDSDVLKEMDTLAHAATGKALVFEVRDVEKDGAKVPTAFVKDGDTEAPLAEFAQSNWAKHLPSLVLQSQSNSGSRQQSQATGVYIPPMSQANGANSQPKTTVEQTQATLNKHYPKRTRQDK